tara:strand:- start:109 stop:669 length:561 start_codon:yes stop_codon:yes gene_type:complete
MTIILNGTTGITTPDLTSNDYIEGNGAVLYPLTSGTAVATTSGTAHDFTGIPSWVTRITIVLASVSTNGGSKLLFQLGTSGGVQTSGYLGASSYIGGPPLTSNFSNGFSTAYDGGGDIAHGLATFCLVNPATGLWAMNHTIGHSNEPYTYTGGGSKTLSGTLDRLRFTTANGTDTFDSGSINILYE